MEVLPTRTMELRDIILPLAGLSNTRPKAMHQTVQFLALHGLQSINDFNSLEPHQGKDLGFHAIEMSGALQRADADWE